MLQAIRVPCSVCGKESASGNKYRVTQTTELRHAYEWSRFVPICKHHDALLLQQTLTLFLATRF